MSSKVRKFKKRPVNSSLSTKQKKEVAKIANKVTKKESEHKQASASTTYADVYDGGGSIQTNMTSIITQGTTDAQRIGDELELTGIHLRMSFINGQGANSYPTINWRVMVFQYKSQDNTPSGTELLTSATANAGVTYGTFSARNIDYLSVYNVLYDKAFQTGGNNGVALTADQNSKLNHYLEFRVPLKYCKRKIQYENSTAVGVNDIYLFVTTDLNSLAVNPQCKYHYTLNYIDP